MTPRTRREGQVSQDVQREILWTKEERWLEMRESDSSRDKERWLMGKKDVTRLVLLDWQRGHRRRDLGSESALIQGWSCEM